MASPLDIARAFNQQRILIVGDAMLDSYYEGRATRLCTEGPVPVVKSHRKVFLPGGAANVAVNCRSLGAEVDLLAVVGNDETAFRLRRALDEHGISDEYLVVDRSRPTTNKLRIIADSQFVVRFDEGDVSDVDGEVQRDLLKRLRKLQSECDAIIVSDYLAGVITPGFVAELGQINADGSKLVIVDSKDLKYHDFHSLTVVTPNHLEAQRASSVPLKANQDLSMDGYVEKVAWDLLSRIDTRMVVITLGAQGALLLQRGKPASRIPARTIEGAHAIGAGDSFVSTLALGLASGAQPEVATRIAVDAATLAVSKERTSSVSLPELLHLLGEQMETGTESTLWEVVRARKWKPSQM
ncbi:MAG: bifunctional ADP-heptose synthase [Chloroflexi bacterium]|nr:bifunctional ADP-heptose synthase [Chloroflexota bacterium]